MSELFFILTTIYVAYVVYVVVEEPKSTAKTVKPSSTESVLTPSGAISATETIVSPVIETAIPVEETVATVKAAAVSSSTLRDPETGEIAKVTNNYRGLKRWLKEALVAEGLLEKVYSNSELNDETIAKIKVALEAIKFITKYHA